MQSDVLTISQQDLISAEIIGESMLKQLKHRGQVRQVQRGGNGREALYDVESLPWRYRVKVYERYPDLEEIQQSKPFVDKIQIDGDAVRYYSQYRMEDGRYLPADKQEIYANDCAILNSFREVIRIADQERLKQSQPKLPRGEYWERAANVVKRIKDQWDNDLPQNARSLQRKYNAYIKGGYETLIPKRYGNSNAAKVLEGDQADTLMHLLAHYNNHDDSKIRGMYNVIASYEDWSKITDGTVRRWREEHSRLIALGRKGKAKYRSNKVMTVKRRRPSYAMAMWSLDGWTCELLYQEVKERKSGRTRVYHNRLIVEVVLDPCCNYPIGYAVGDSESTELITAALRNAIEHTEELTGRKLLTNQLQMDNFDKKAMSPVYAMLAKYVTPAEVANAKAKPVESYFKHLNENYCQCCLNWSGKGVNNKDGKQPNPDALNVNKRQFPDREGLIRQIGEIIAMERRLKHDEYMHYVEAMPHQHTLEMSREDWLYLFGERTARTIAISNIGIAPRIKGVKRQYDTFDTTFRDYEHLAWRVCYDPNDYDSILVVSEDGSRRYLLHEKYEQPMALVERTEGDARELQRVLDHRREQERQDRHILSETAQRAYAVVERVTAKRAAIESGAKSLDGGAKILDDKTSIAEHLYDDMLAKIMVTNNKGQHKSERRHDMLTQGAEDAEYEDAIDEVAAAGKAALDKRRAEAEEENDFSLFF